MRIEVTKLETVKYEVEAELPYYYAHDLMSDYSDCIIYGRIDETTHLSIKETENHNGEFEYELQKESHKSIANTGLGCYFDKEHKGSKEQYEAVKQRAIEFIGKM